MVKSTATVFRKRSAAGCSENDCPDDPHHSDELCRGKASDLFGELTGIAVLLTMLPYFYSCVDLIRFEGVNIRNFVSLICSVLGCVFCFIALMGASSFELAGTFIVSLIILMFYARKMHERQSHSMDNHTASNAH